MPSFVLWIFEGCVLATNGVAHHTTEGSGSGLKIILCVCVCEREREPVCVCACAHSCEKTNICPLYVRPLLTDALNPRDLEKAGSGTEDQLSLCLNSHVSPPPTALRVSHHRLRESRIIPCLLTFTHKLAKLLPLLHFTSAQSDEISRQNWNTIIKFKKATSLQSLPEERIRLAGGSDVCPHLRLNCPSAKIKSPDWRRGAMGNGSRVTNRHHV